MKEKVSEWIDDLEIIINVPVTFRKNRQMEHILLADMKEFIKENEKKEFMILTTDEKQILESLGDKVII